MIAKSITPNTKYVSIERKTFANGQEIIDLCFWSDKEKNGLEGFKEYNSITRAKRHLNLLIAQKNLKKA